METRTRNRLRLAVGLAATAGACFALTGVALAGGSCHEPQSEARTTTVEMSALCFTPTVVRVDAGATVEFVNRDSVHHDVVGNAFSWGRPERLRSGDSFTTVFEAAGVYPYACTIHPGMVGAVVVGEAGQEDAIGSPQPDDTELASGPWRTVGIVAAVPLFAALIWRWSSRRETEPTTGD